MPNKKRKKANDRVFVSGNEIESILPPGVNEEMLRGNPWFEEIFESLRAEIKVLILADGDISFVEGKFGLTELIYKALLPRATAWEKLKITTAHRSKNGKGAELKGFKFTENTFKNKDDQTWPWLYHQVWLFGFNREIEKDGKCIKHEDVLKPSELILLTNFMNAGGGVFATGDHQDLGAALCGEVPRVRSMRKWFWCGLPAIQQAPGLGDSTRIDTLREGDDPGFVAIDQADNTPQEIRPRHKKIEGQDNSAPHDLLRDGERTITVLPDHMHEGECVVPKGDDLKKCILFDGVNLGDEFPKLPNVEDRHPPEVVAVSTSAGGYLRSHTGVEPVEPRCYNVIVAYDGQYVNVGRVVVDASFHHFVDINLKGTETQRTGLYDKDGNPTKDYLAIRQYYRNIVLWLCPPEVRSLYHMNMLLALRYMSPLIEEIRSIRPVQNVAWEEIVFAGTVTQRAIEERFSQSAAMYCTLTAASLSMFVKDSRLTQQLQRLVEEFVNPWAPFASHDAKSNLFLNTGIITTIILGGAMLGIAANLPGSSCDVRQRLDKEKSPEEFLKRSIGDGTSHALLSLLDVIQGSNNKLANFSRKLVACLRPGNST
jgi:hypothetical protein